MENLGFYNPPGSELRGHQLRMLEMLKVVDGICFQHDIKYWLSSGTLLGAVRHGGFIPWDDDLDIELLRKDYLKLIRILETELPEEYALQTNKTDKNYVAPYAKVRCLKSLIVENNSRDINYKYKGIYIDIFCLEKNPLIISKITSKIHHYLYCFTYMKNDKYGFKGNITRVLYLILSFFYFLLRLVLKIVPEDDLRQTFGAGFHKKRLRQDICKLKRMKFEDGEFCVPYNTNSYLKIIYGDYAKIPSFDTIVSHISSVKIND